MRYVIFYIVASQVIAAEVRIPENQPQDPASLVAEMAGPDAVVVRAWKV